MLMKNKNLPYGMVMEQTKKIDKSITPEASKLNL